MRKLLLFFICSFFCLLSVQVKARDFYFDIAGNSINLSDNSSVESEVEISFNEINITNSITLKNSGIIKGNINLCEGCNLKVKNTGVIESNFTIPETSKITQVINDYTDITNINFNHSFDVLVQNAENLSFNDLLSLGGDKIIIDNSGLVLDSFKRIRFARFSLNPEIKIIGNVDVYLNDENDLLSGPLLSNVDVGEGIVNIHTNYSNPLYTVSSFIKDNNLYAALVRETDYEKIFKNYKGVFLNELRSANPNSLLLNALDNAADMDSINQIMGKSVLFNPVGLLKPIKSFNNFKLLDLDFDSSIGLIFRPDFIISESFYSYGLNIGAGLLNYDKFKLSLNAYGAYIDFADDINEYTATIAGIKTDIIFIPVDYLFFNLTAGASFTKFDVGDIFYNENIINNPDSLSLYSATDVGLFLLRNNKITLAAFTGFITNHDEIVDISDFDYDARLGLKLDFNNEEIGSIYYKFGLLLTAETDGGFGAGMRYSFLSKYDGAGGGIDLSAIKDDYGWSYKISVDVKLAF